MRWTHGLLLLLFPLVTEAQIFRGPLSSALGGTGVAGLTSAEAGLMNPALVPMFGESAFETYYRDGAAAAGESRTAFGIGAVDNGVEVMAPGSLHILRLRDFGGYDSDFYHLAVGERVGKRFSFGLSGYHLDSRLGQNRERHRQWNFSVGGLWMVNTYLGFGYVIRNVAQPSGSVPRPLRQTMEQALGMLVGLGDYARLRLDITRPEQLNPDKAWVTGVGFEGKTSPLFVSRFGYRYDAVANRRLLSAGFGFDGPRLKVDYAFEKSPDSGSGALHGVDLRIVF